MFEKIRDFKTVGRSFINTLNGIMAITLTALAGTIDANDVESNKLLKNLSISFGASIAGMQLLLAFGIDVLIAKYTNGKEEEDYVKKLLESDSVEEKVLKGNELLGKIIYELKKTKEDMTPENKQIYSNQLNKLENAYGTLGNGLI
jgi:MoaA/NifB/PqqE/SkfB family radical SAM enzyme